MCTFSADCELLRLICVGFQHDHDQRTRAMKDPLIRFKQLLRIQTGLIHYDYIHRRYLFPRGIGITPLIAGNGL